MGTVRDTPLGSCIGSTIVDITAVDTEEFLAGEQNFVYFHLSNGKTIFATMGVEGEGLMGIIDHSDEEET